MNAIQLFSAVVTTACLVIICVVLVMIAIPDIRDRVRAVRAHRRVLQALDDIRQIRYEAYRMADHPDMTEFYRKNIMSICNRLETQIEYEMNGRKTDEAANLPASA